MDSPKPPPRAVRPRPAPAWWLALALLQADAAGQPAGGHADALHWLTGPSWVEWGTSGTRLRLGRDATPVARALTAGRLGGLRGPADNRPPELVERDDRLVQLVWSGGGTLWQGRLATLSDSHAEDRHLQRLLGVHLAFGQPGAALHLGQQDLLRDGVRQRQRAASFELSGPRLSLGLSVADTAAAGAAPALTHHAVLRWRQGAWRAYASWKRMQADDPPAPSAPRPWATERGLTLAWSAGERDGSQWTLACAHRDGAPRQLSLAFEHRL